MRRSLGISEPEAPKLEVIRMRRRHLRGVLRIEQQVYPRPWSMSLFLSELALQRRFGFRFMDSAEDAFRSRQRVEVESELADKKFEIFTGKNDEMNWARQVFTPTFIVWLGEEAHEGLAFELSAGALVVNIKGHLKTAHELGLAAAVLAGHRDGRPHALIELAAELLDEQLLLLGHLDVPFGDQHLTVSGLHAKEPHGEGRL